MKIYSLILLVIALTVTIEAEPLKVPNYDPFKQTQKILKKKRVVYKVKARKKGYTLYAIYDNKVNINGKFYRLGERIGSCSVWKIFEDKVLLKCHRKIKTLEFIKRKSYKRVGK